MPAERAPMRKVREVLRLRHALGVSERQIAIAIGVSRSTVGEYLRRAAVIGITWPVPEEMDDAELERRLFTPPTFEEKLARPLPDWNHVHKELKRRGVTLLLLWEEYRAEHADGYGYSRFCDLYRDWRKTHLADACGRRTGRPRSCSSTSPATRCRCSTAAAGDGATRPHLRRGAGRIQLHLRAGALDEGLPDWIGAHVNAFNAIGGVPKAVVCDNLKAGVTATCRYEPGINRTYQELAEHYDTAILPTRPRKPRDKAKVEVGVLIVERYVLARLRNRRFFSLFELNAAIREIVVRSQRPDHAQARRQPRRAVRHRSIGRRSKRCRANAYQYAEWKKCRVAPDYHVEVGDHYYSVPSRLIREQVEARITDTTIEILHKGGRVASHARSHVRHRHTTIPSTCRARIGATPNGRRRG